MAAQHRAAGHAKVRSARPLMSVWVISDRDGFHLMVIRSHDDAQARQAAHQLASADTRRFDATLAGPEDVVGLSVSRPEGQHPQPAYHDLSRRIFSGDQHRNCGVVIVERLLLSRK